jgi:nitrate reductase NapD
MNVSAILVVTPLARLEAACRMLDSLPGIEVHHTDRATGRIIVTQEAATVAEEVDGLKRIKRLPYVILAEMVQHHFEEDPDIVAGPVAAGDNVPSLLED